MMELIKFVLSDFWIFSGSVILLSMCLTLGYNIYDRFLRFIENLCKNKDEKKCCGGHDSSK